MNMPGMPNREKFLQTVKEGLVGPEDVSVIFYQRDRLRYYCDQLASTFPEKSIHAIAIKTCPLPEVIRAIGQLGHSHEAASAGEVMLAARESVGMIVYDAPAKHHFEMEKMHAFADRMIVHANSFYDLQQILTHPFPNVGLRINPEVSPGVDRNYDVSHSRSKFGVPISRKEDIIRTYVAHDCLNSIHFHIGSGMTDIDPMAKALDRIEDLRLSIQRARRQAGRSGQIDYLDIGGGLRAESDYGDVSRLKALGDMVRARYGTEESPTIITEFGQYIHTHNAFLVTKVSDVIPHADGSATLICNAGANIFVRQAYTNAPAPFRYAVIESPHGDPTQSYDLAGPLCFSGDYIAKEVKLPRVDIGDHLLIDSIGANTFALYSMHCSMPFPKVVYLL